MVEEKPSEPEKEPPVLVDESWLWWYAPHIYDKLPSIPYGSYRLIYSGSDSAPHIIGGIPW